MRGTLERLREAADGRFVYLASPYSKHPKGMEYAFQRAAAGAGYLIGRGVPTFCPIAHSHPIAEHGDIPAESHDIWLPADRPLMQGAGVLCVLMLEGWRDSHGVNVERQTFARAGKPVFLMTDDPYTFW